MTQLSQQIWQFLGYRKDFANLLFWVLWAWLVMPTKIDSINLFQSFGVYLYANNQLHLSFLSWDIAKILQTCYIGYFGHTWPLSPKMVVSACRKPWCLSWCIKSNLSLNSFLEHCKDIANLLIWVLWACLDTSTRGNSINLLETLKFIYKQKINLIPTFFLEISL